MKKIFLVLVGLLVFAQISFSQWIPIGPSKGIINNLCKAGDYFFAGTNSGIYKSGDNGNNWQLIISGLGNKKIKSLKSFNDIIFTISTNDIGSNEIFYSSDLGNSWRNITGTLASVSSSDIGANQNYIFVGTDMGLYRSNNFGTNWYCINDTMKFYYNPLFVINNYVFTNGVYPYFSNFYVSSNNGESWNYYNNRLKNKSITSVIQKENLFFASAYSGVYVSSNYGITWDSVINGMTKKSILALETDNYNIYALSNQNRVIYKTSNNGVNWIATDSVTQLINCLSTKLDEVMIGTQNGIYYTGNKKNWFERNMGLAAQNVTTSAVLGNRIYVGTLENGVFVSSDNGSTWVEKNKGLPYLQITKLTSNSNYIFAGGAFGRVFRSNNTDSSWTLVSSFYNNSNDLTTYNEDVYVGYYRYLYKSTNNGNNWFIVGNILPGYSYPGIISTHFLNNNIFVGTNQGVYSTTDSGFNWNYKGLSNMQITQFMNYKNNLFTATQNGIYYSSDEGNNWLHSSLGNMNVNYFCNIDSVLIAATNLGIYISLDDGVSWKIRNYGLPNVNINSLLVKDSIVYAGSQYCSILKRTFPDLISEYIPPVIEIPKTFYLYQNYPNPFNSGTKIKIDIPENYKNNFVSLKIFDINGREIGELFNQIFSAGTYEYYFSSGNLSSGIYFYQLKINSSIQTRRMVLIR